jgi:hypothetical protein
MSAQHQQLRTLKTNDILFLQYFAEKESDDRHRPNAKARRA